MNIRKLSLRQKIKKINKDDEEKWYDIIYHNDIPEDLLREFSDKVNWILVIQYKQLSKDFLREMQIENINQQYGYISAFQYTNQKFIEQRKDKINWQLITFDRTNFSQQFLLKWSQKLDWEAIWKIKRKWSQEFWEYLKKKVGK